MKLAATRPSRGVLLVGGLLALGAWVTAALLVWRIVDPPSSGQALNQEAWQASFLERGEPVPATGPREGPWGSRLAAAVADPATAWRLAPQVEPGLLDIDARGWQHWCPGSPPTRALALVGGSVAFGAYASSIDATYFAVLGRALEARGQPTAVRVISAGAWKSSQELAALERDLGSLDIDLVVLLDGLNDLTAGASAQTLHGEQVETEDGSSWRVLYHRHDYSERIAAYLANVERSARVAADDGVPLLVALQPALFERVPRTPLERRLLTDSLMPHASLEVLQTSYAALRGGLAAVVARHPNASYYDASRVFGGEASTVFADLWHFADAGHRILGEALAKELAPLLATRPSRSTWCGGSPPLRVRRATPR